MSQNYQDFNILESSTTAKVNWNRLQRWKAWGGGGGLFVLCEKRWGRWRAAGCNQLSVLLRKQGSRLEIFLAVLSLSDPDKRKSSLNTAGTKCSSRRVVVVFQRCYAVFESQSARRPQSTTATRVKIPVWYKQLQCTSHWAKCDKMACWDLSNLRHLMSLLLLPVQAFPAYLRFKVKVAMPVICSKTTLVAVKAFCLCSNSLCSEHVLLFSFPGNWTSQYVNPKDLKRTGPSFSHCIPRHWGDKRCWFITLITIRGMFYREQSHIKTLRKKQQTKHPWYCSWNIWM